MSVNIDEDEAYETVNVEGLTENTCSNKRESTGSSPIPPTEQSNAITRDWNENGYQMESKMHEQGRKLQSHGNRKNVLKITKQAESVMNAENRMDSFGKQRSRSVNADKFRQMESIKEAAINNRCFCRASSTSDYFDGSRSNGKLELVEPFSDSDDERKGDMKMMLPIPRGRIRTLSGTVPAIGYSPKWGGPTMCLCCFQFFDLPSMMESFSEHLLLTHRIAIIEIESIVDLKRYVEQWRVRLGGGCFESILPKIVPDRNSPLWEVVDYYYEISPKIPEEYSLRQQLALRRLEEVLACQQREREDSSFIQQCIFCRYVAHGNRAQIVHHLYNIHRMNLGSPDNLIFVSEYIDYLKLRLAKNECLYCEVVFESRSALMDHIRVEGHREVNPKNHYYDRFYIINYLELGKRWLDVLAEDFEDSMPSFIDSDDDDELWKEWQADNVDMDETILLCLFCDQTYASIGSLIEHFKGDHGFDILQVIGNEKLDVYGRVKLINFIRRQNHSLDCFVCGRGDFTSLKELRKHQAMDNHISEGMPPRSVWDIELNLISLFRNDNLLWVLESYLSEPCALGDVGTDHLTEKELKERLIRESKNNTVEEVIAEDLPNLMDSALSNPELYESLK